jgi:hypothetical protein
MSALFARGNSNGSLATSIPVQQSKLLVMVCVFSMCVCVYKRYRDKRPSPLPLLHQKKKKKLNYKEKEQRNDTEIRGHLLYLFLGEGCRKTIKIYAQVLRYVLHRLRHLKKKTGETMGEM